MVTAGTGAPGFLPGAGGCRDPPPPSPACAGLSSAALAAGSQAELGPMLPFWSSVVWSRRVSGHLLWPQRPGPGSPLCWRCRPGAQWGAFRVLSIIWEQPPSVTGHSVVLGDPGLGTGLMCMVDRP